MAKVLDGVKNFRVTHADYDGSNVVINVMYDIQYLMEGEGETKDVITFNETFIGFRLSDEDVDKLINAIEKTGKIKKVR